MEPSRPSPGEHLLVEVSTALDAHESDTPAEVDALFRTQRRIAVGYFAVFLLVTLGVPALTLVLDWWSQGRVVGGMSPAFAMAAVVLYAFFALLAGAAGALASAVEDRMLGDPTRDGGPYADDAGWDDVVFDDTPPAGTAP